MSIDHQSVSSLESSTMRKRRFRRVSDMFTLRTTLTRRERRRKKKFRFPNRIGNGKRKNEQKENRKKSSRTKFSVWKIVPPPRIMQVVPEEKGGGGAGRTCLKHGPPCSSPFKKIKSQKISKIIFRRFDSVLKNWKTYILKINIIININIFKYTYKN